MKITLSPLWLYGSAESAIWPYMERSYIELNQAMGNSTRVEYNGIRFDSMAEAGYYIWLKSEEEKGYVSNISLQPQWDLWADRRDGEPVKIGVYTADFIYQDHRTDTQRVIDVKGQVPHRNRSGKHVSGGKGWTAFRLRCKIVEANYGIEVEVVAGKPYTELYQRVTGTKPKRKAKYVRRKR